MGLLLYFSQYGLFDITLSLKSYLIIFFELIKFKARAAGPDKSGFFLSEVKKGTACLYLFSPASRHISFKLTPSSLSIPSKVRTAPLLFLKSAASARIFSPSLKLLRFAFMNAVTSSGSFLFLTDKRKYKRWPLIFLAPCILPATIISAIGESIKASVFAAYG
ncbi:MAG: hypothetical protein BWY84_00254 [Candidatus Aerophobetes bacterium ADurb.Bin490]|nr:MAG: hypothetical protein BWY84_00254 [Candidatus Aerophobetes bacterium ADurb.Bin490]